MHEEGEVFVAHLGLGEVWGAPVASPTPLNVPGLRATAAAAGSLHSLLLDRDGAVWSCGAGWEGPLGHGDEATVPVPRRISSLAVAVQSIAAGAAHSLAVCSGGQVYAWGWGRHGQLGHGGRSSVLSPRRVEAVSLPTRAIQAAAPPPLAAHTRALGCLHCRCRRGREGRRGGAGGRGAAWPFHTPRHTGASEVFAPPLRPPRAAPTLCSSARTGACCSAVELLRVRRQAHRHLLLPLPRPPPPPPPPSLPLLPSLSSSPPRPPSLSPPPTASPSLPLKAPSRTRTTTRTRVRTSGSRETCSRLAASRSLLCAWCASPPLATAPAQRGRAGAASGGASGGRARLGREGGAEPAGMDVRGQGGVAGGRAWLGADPLSCRLRRPGRCARFPAAACVARRLVPSL